MSTATLHIEKKKSSVPELRFLGFDKDWEELKFGKLYSFQTTNSLSRDKLNYEEGKVYNIHYGDIHTKFQPHFYLRNESVPYINGDVDLSKIKAELYCKTGDIIIADASEDYADIGKSIELIDIDNVKLLAGLHTLLARPISDKIFVGFTSYLLKSWTLRKQIMTIAQGSKVLSLSTGRVSNLELNIPTFPEQKKIASFLSAVDEKIQQLSCKKELLEQYKKGVMQQLFSGKLRFKDENGEDYADWKIIKVQELINKKAIISLLDGNHGALYPKSEEFAEEGIPYVAANNLVNGQVKFSECKYLPVERAKKFKKGIAKNGDVLFAHNATVGPTALLKTELDHIILSTTVTYYRCDLNILSNTYLLHYFNSDNFISQYSRVMSQSTRNQVPITMQKKFTVDFPCLEEQQKIANFLSSIDTKIESTSQQINQMQSFKKGLLQQMFV